MNSEQLREPDRSGIPQVEPQPLPRPTLENPRVVLPVIGGALLVAALVVSFWGAPPSTPAGAGPEIPPELAARYATQFASAHGRLLPVDLSSESAQGAVVSMIPAPEPVARQLVTEALAGGRALGKIIVWDNMAEDGDVVRLECGGLSIEVRLKKSGEMFVFPYKVGDSLRITGLKDGDGGGITVAVELASGAVPLPPLAPGETRALPLY